MSAETTCTFNNTTTRESHLWGFPWKISEFLTRRLLFFKESSDCRAPDFAQDQGSSHSSWSVPTTQEIIGCHALSLCMYRKHHALIHYTTHTPTTHTPYIPLKLTSRYNTHHCTHSCHTPHSTHTAAIPTHPHILTTHIRHTALLLWG